MWSYETRLSTQKSSVSVLRDLRNRSRVGVWPGGAMMRDSIEGKGIVDEELFIAIDEFGVEQ